MTDAVVATLTRDEGLRLTVYDDATGQPIGPGSVVKGHPTIGIGRCLDRNGITSQEAAYLLGNDVAKVRAQLGSFDWFGGLDAVRQDVLVCMAFQLGTHGVLAFGAMIQALKTRRWPAAAQAMQDSLWAEQTPLRAQRMAQSILTGVA